MPKELTKVQKLKKYGVPKEILIAKDVIMYVGEVYKPSELIARIESFNAKYPGSSKIIELEQTEDYYDACHNLVGFASRALTEAEQNVLIAKGDKENTKKEKTFGKAKADYVKALKKKYPNYQLPDPEESNAPASNN